MLNMKKILGLYSILIGTFFSNTLYAQRDPNKEKAINFFIKAVFVKKIPAKVIMDSCMYFEPSTKYSLEQRSQLLEFHLDRIRSQKSSVLDVNNYYLIPYEKYKKEKIKFLKDVDDIFVLISRDSPVLYFYFKGDKIRSFDYLLKDTDAYFVTY